MTPLFFTDLSDDPPCGVHADGFFVGRLEGRPDRRDVSL
jgi:hypothetical protein